MSDRPFAAVREAVGAGADIRIMRRVRAGPASAPNAVPVAWRLTDVFAVAGLLVLAVAIRVQGLPGGGLVVNDEGWAIANGRYLLTLLTHPSRWGTFRGLFIPGLTLNRHHVFPLGNDWKLGHDLAVGSISAAGVTPEDLNWYPALAGVAMVVVLAALAWQRWGPPAAAVAGVFAGSLPLSIVYGHRLLAEADGMLAVALMLYLLDGWWGKRPSARRVMLTLLLCLATLTLSYRYLSTLLPLFVILGWLVWWYVRRAMPPTVRTGRLVIVCLIPAMAVVTIYLLVAAANAVGLPPLPGVLRYWFVRSSSGVSLPFRYPDFYVRTFWDFGGPVFMVAAGLAALALVSSWTKIDPLAAIALGSFVGIVLFFSAAPDKAPRAIAICIPFAALVVARAVAVLNGKALQWGVALTVCLACLVSGWMGSNVARASSGTGQAGRWLAAHTGPIVAYRGDTYLVYVDQPLDSISVVHGDRRWEVVQPRDPAHRMVVPDGDLTIGDLRRDGVRWAVVDADALYYGGPAFRELVTCGRPAAEFNDPAGWSTLEFLEVADSLHLDYGAVMAKRVQTLAAGHGHQTIRIYDLGSADTAGCSAS